MALFTASAQQQPCFAQGCLFLLLPFFLWLTGCAHSPTTASSATSPLRCPPLTPSLLCPPLGFAASLPTHSCEPVATAEVPTAEIKQRLVQVVNDEWVFFGQQTLQIEQGIASIPRLGAWEDDAPQYVERIQQYWCAVGRTGFTQSNVCTQPWSAVFISWAMRQAGVPETVLPSRAAHWQYLRYLLDHPSPYFRVHERTAYAPQVGDLICAVRTEVAWQQVEQLSRAPMHCDVVVNIEQPYLYAIGGNVRNSVTKIRVQLDENGNIQLEVGGRPWLLVVENLY